MGSSCRRLSALTLQKGPTPANSQGMVGFSKGWKVRQGRSTSAEQGAKQRSTRTACCKGTTSHTIKGQARPDQRASQDPTPGGGGGRGWEHHKNRIMLSRIPSHPPGTCGSSTLIQRWCPYGTPASNNLTALLLSSTLLLHHIAWHEGRAL